MNLSNVNNLDREENKDLAELLNDLLANYFIFKQNVKGYYYNIKDDQFLDLYIFFKELYISLTIKTDEIAEKILKLGYKPEFRFSTFLQKSKILESYRENDVNEIINELIFSFQVLLNKQKNIITKCSLNSNYKIDSLLKKYINEQKKNVCKYDTYFKKVKIMK